MSPSVALTRSLPSPFASPSPFAPDRFTFQPLLGWRTWFVRKSDGALLSPTAPREEWPDRERLEAHCRVIQANELPTKSWADWHPPSVPAADCRCGIYAQREPDLARVAFLLAAEDPKTWCPAGLCPAYGQVSLWGLTVECEDGWRAAYAYPYAVTVADPSLVRTVRDRYGVDVEGHRR